MKFNFWKKKKPEIVREPKENIKKKLKECTENFKNINHLIKEENDEIKKNVLRKERDELFSLMEDLKRKLGSYE
jgi:BMFP domain-containing protein YqiC